MLSYMVQNQFKILNERTLVLIWIKTLGVHTKVSLKMTNRFNVRWAFNVGAWKPTEEEILAASSFIQKEEKERISRYVFLNDAKSSLIGRLMLRKYVHESMLIPYDEIRFRRDARGKPYLIGTGDVHISFNVSHQGDYVVLSGNMEKNIGIDVMKIEPPVNKNIQDFFRIMTRQFSHHEWATIYSFPSVMQQVACFYRFWCLKESYVKNIGLGITIPLDQISFSIKTLKLKVGEVVTDTKLYENDILKQDWIFEETLLDEKHTVAVSLLTGNDLTYVPIPYAYLTFDEITKEAKPLFEPDQEFKNDFMKKEMKDV